MRPRGGPRDADLPAGMEWYWRPGLFRRGIPTIVAPASGHRLCDETALWHDCPNRALTLQPCARTHPDGPHPLRIELSDFAGSFLSLTLDLPGTMSAMLAADRIVQLDVAMDAERPVRPYARINLVQGPNIETMLRQSGEPITGQGGTGRIAFDLAYGELANRPVDRAWLDLILESPRMAELTLRDARLSGRARAQI